MELQIEERLELLRLAEEQRDALLLVLEAHHTQWVSSLRAEVAGRWRTLQDLACEKPLQPEQWDPVPENPFEETPFPIHLEQAKLQVAVPALPWEEPGDLELSDSSAFASEAHHALHVEQAQSMTNSRRISAVKPVDFHLTETSAPGHTKLRGQCRRILDLVAAVLVILNCVMLMVELELEGRAVGAKLGLSAGLNLAELMEYFQVVDTVFIIIFFSELVLRFILDGTSFFKDVANAFDSCLVLIGCVDILVIGPMMGNENAAMMRVVRTLKSLRGLRLLRTFRFVRGLRLLVKACQCFLPSLCWAMVLLAVFMSIGALVLGNLLLDFSANDSWALEDRQWVWERYGTAYRALYTLYEITFAGNWPTNVRPVLDKVSHLYVIFFVLYVTVISFAVIRVISAVFLKDTLDAAQNDAENLVVERLRKKDEYVQKLEAVFMAIDKTGDGMITEARLTDILSHPKVVAYFQTLDIDVQESAANLFHIIDNGDGELTVDEFIEGIMKCKGQARAVDQVAMRAELRQLDAKVTRIVQALRSRPGERPSERGL